jgi:hypothetical protein
LAVWDVTANADERTIRFYRQLRDMQKLPSIEVLFTEDGKKIVLRGKDIRRNVMSTVSINSFLDAQQGIKTGST